MRPRIVIAGMIAAVALSTACAGPGSRRPDRDGTMPANTELRRALNSEAQEALDANENERALGVLEQLTVIAPKSCETQNRLGKVWRNLGRLDLAETSYRRALSLDPHSADALIGLAGVEFQQGRLQEARGHLDTAIELAPGRIEAHELNGRVYESLGDFDGALGSYFRALGLDASCAAAQLRIASIQLDRKQYDQSLARLTNVLELTPDDPEARFQRGRAHLALNHVSEAINDLRTASLKLPNRPDVYYHLALALEEGQLKPDALKAAEHASKLAPAWEEAKGLSERLRR
jgi:tetratricopeptide (TPR) repeat protein